MKHLSTYLIIAAVLLAASGLKAGTKRKPEAEILFYNGKIYTVNEAFERVEAIAVTKGKIVRCGSTAELRSLYDFAREINLEGRYVYPGFIDAHCHLMSLGAYQYEVDLRDTRSWDEVVKRCLEFYRKHPEIKALKGRGWDQNNWANKQFPDNTELNRLFPLIPVLLKRVDGHAAIVNDYVLKKAGYDTGTKVPGGELFIRNNLLTGVLLDNAVDRVEDNSSIFPPKDKKQLIKEFDTAQKICFSKGLTSVADAGIPRRIAEFYRSHEHAIRIYAMLNAHEENMDLMDQPHKTDNLNISSFKLYADGSLGARGACLLQPYSDQKNSYGFLTTGQDEMEELVRRIAQSRFQLNSHCIGDSANRLVLSLYGKYLPPGNDRRWRIEHAQVINEKDLELFGQFNIIPSVQPVHATSDMTWAGKRLGDERIHSAYQYRRLLEHVRYIALGTDFPVEDVNPLHTFYAAVSRQDGSGKPAGGFLPDQRLSREEALRGMTIWAATAAFEEKEKGSLETDKFADFVVLDVDLLNDDLLKIRNARIIRTYVGGVLVYSSK